MDDEAERMDLALNTNFDPSLFEGWPEDDEKAPSQSSQWDGGLPQFDMGDFRRSTSSLQSDKDESSQGDTTNQPQEATQQPAQPEAPTSHTLSTQLHPLAIQASANCPPYDSANPTPLDLQQAALLPLAMNALAAGATLPPFLLQAGLAAAAQLNITGPPQAAAPTNAPTTAPAPSNDGSAPAPPSTISAAPPFLLFDAPVELRANFMQSQRAHGLPVLFDNNQYHFGVAVNGFHPQTTRLVDGRHGDIGDKRAKNAKEQRRAQRIAELIDDLRIKMEKGGWNVGLKSKLNTLSSCADYVKHLIKSNKDKEAAVEKARCDLEAKRQKIEEEKTSRDPSDPESTTSTLTVSTRSSSSSSKKEAKKVSETEHSEGDETKSERKRSLPASPREETKKRRLTSRESTLSSSTSSGGDESGNQSPAGKRIRVDHASSVSDITDSNKGSGDDRSRNKPRKLGPAASSVSSEAAVADGKAGDDHGDVLVRKRKNDPNPTSMDAGFELDYEEVFVKSNVPQLLATTSGRIIAWNEFFLKATGLSEREVERATMFSLVQSNKLSNLFEIVAKSLRSGDPVKKTSAEKVWDYSAITLPCVSFGGGSNAQLFITVTLMNDDDPRKRCFHCVLTDSPGTKEGSLGPITPELLKMLFTAPVRSTPKGKKTTKA